jgi:acetylornithine/N-succinyldiaminopimelate aminotransferase
MTQASIMNTYGRLPVSFCRGEGAYLYDENGKQYLDAIAGIGVNALGHSHPAVSDAIATQANTLIHTSNLYRIEKQEKLAELLCGISDMERVFFANSGAEANEAAIKIARLYGHNKGVKKPRTIVVEGSFHGRTMATLSATGNRKIQAGFEPLVAGFVRAPYNDIAALEKIAENNSDVVAILVEPILGEGGVVVPDSNYLRALRELCDKHQWLLMLDEVQTGNGRTGSYFAYQGCDILPDVVTTAKGLGNGVPIGACLARGEAANTLQPGNHGSTYGGNPLACATALAVVHTISSEKLCDHAASMGKLIIDSLTEGLCDCKALIEVRGRGLMIGVELDRECGELVSLALEQGLLINVAAGYTIRMLPPLIISAEQATELADKVCSLVLNFVNNP